MLHLFDFFSALVPNLYPNSFQLPCSFSVGINFLSQCSSALVLSISSSCQVFLSGPDFLKLPWLFWPYCSAILGSTFIAHLGPPSAVCPVGLVFLQPWQGEALIGRSPPLRPSWRRVQGRIIWEIACLKMPKSLTPDSLAGIEFSDQNNFPLEFWRYCSFSLWFSESLTRVFWTIASNPYSLTFMSFLKACRIFCLSSVFWNLKCGDYKFIYLNKHSQLLEVVLLQV